MNNKKALIVDDSKSACFVLAKMLRHFGIESDYVLSASVAFEYLSENTPSVIFMDHSMPDMNGIEAAQKIKQEANWVDIPIIMFTAKTGDAYHQKAEQVGALDVMPKTMDIQNLSEVLRKAQLIEGQDQTERPDIEMPSAEQKLQIWIESVIENKLAPTLGFRIDQATKEIREETTQNSDRLYRNSLQFHIRQQKQLVKQIEAERDYLSVSYQTNQLSLFKKIAASLGVLVVVVLAVLTIFWSMIGDLNDQTQAQIASMNKLQDDYYQLLKQQKLASVSAKRSLEKRLTAPDDPNARIDLNQNNVLFSVEGSPVARLIETPQENHSLFAQSFTNYTFHLNELSNISQYQGEKFFSSQGCFGEVWVEAPAGQLVSDDNLDLWFTPADSTPVETAVFSRMSAEGQCENLYKEDMVLVPLLPNDPIVTGINTAQLRLE